MPDRSLLDQTGPNQTPEPLTEKQEKAIAALMTCGTVKAAAKRCGVSKATMHVWLTQPAFRDAYREARMAAVQQAVGLLQQGTTKAVRTLAGVMNDPASKCSSKVAAARAWLEMALKGLDHDELEWRLEDLERRQNGGDRG